MKVFKNKYAIFLLLCLFLIVFVAPFASQSPDGLEWVAQIKGFLEKGELNPTYWKFSLMPDYEVSMIANKTLSKIISGLLGLFLSIGISLLYFRLLHSKRNK